jgi:hypothetical protein
MTTGRQSSDSAYACLQPRMQAVDSVTSVSGTEEVLPAPKHPHARALTRALELAQRRRLEGREI